MKQTLLLAFSIVFYLSGTAQFTFENNTDLLNGFDIEGEHSISVADIDGDGYDDLVVLDNYIIYFQDPDGGDFIELDLDYDDGPSTWGMCSGDIDNDGYTDMLYGGYFNGLSIISHSPFIDLYTKTLHDSEEFLVFLQGVNFADIDSDGNLDIYACHDVGPSRIYIGDGEGGFTQNTDIIDTELNGGGEEDSGNYGSLFTDLNNDGLIDLYVAKCRQGVSDPTDPRRINLLYINNGDGTYTEEAEDWNLNSGDQSWSADFGDIDNDGDFDLILTQHSGTEFIEIFENDGDGNFTDITATSGMNGQFTSHPIQSKFADFDNDGYMDILVSGSSNFIFGHNNGDNTFTPMWEDESNIYNSMNSFALGDLNHDGYTDVYATPGGYGGGWGSDGTDSLYFNAGGENTYLTFDLEGVISNRDGIGARVTVYSELGIQIRDIRSGESYGIQNSLTAHFGMGELLSADSVTITWPSGIFTQLYNVETNQFLNILEVESGVGISELDLNNQLSVYPNPSSDFISVELNDVSILNDRLSRVQIIDPLGRSLYDERYQNGEKIDVQGFKSGLYIINLIVDNEIVASKKVSIN